jgi:hypothetical protein
VYVCMCVCVYVYMYVYVYACLSRSHFPDIENPLSGPNYVYTLY